MRATSTDRRNLDGVRQLLLDVSGVRDHQHLAESSSETGECSEEPADSRKPTTLAQQVSGAAK